ncbi:hypothetical protein [Bernardetia sp.]|uniref:hypothetical protein n=1 Tax=Bernardetia sp. TaxID=1937974 RepID=UPI0025BA4D84|nr:hypothetical protein [Bernardetia sp.]
MLNQFKTILAFAALLVFFTACGEHNQPAPNKGKNLDSERIYGVSREAEPAQLPNQYDDPEGINNRSKDIYSKMYAPKEVSSVRQDYPVKNTAKEEVEATTETSTEETSAE